MAIEQLENSPLVDRVRHAVMTAILEKDFDGRLPSETALAEMLNVSRTTVRSALQALEQDGLIVRRRSVGTTINDHVGAASLTLQRMVGFDWLLRENGYKVDVKLSWRRGTCPPELAPIFQDIAGADCLLSDKTYYADGDLAIHIRDAVHVREVKDSLLASFEKPGAMQELPSLFEFSQIYFKKPIDHAVAQILPMLKQRAKDSALTVSKTQPFVRLHETHYTTKGKPVAYSVVDFDPRFGRFEVFRRR